MTSRRLHRGILQADVAVTWGAFAFLVCAGLAAALTGQERAEYIASRLQVPNGFRVDLYWRGNAPITNARSIAVSGASKKEGPVIVYVSSRGAGRVYALVDHDGDGIADSLTIVLDNIVGANGIAWRDGALYASGFQTDKENRNKILYGYIKRYDGIDNAALAGQAYTQAPVLVTSRLSNETQHGSRYLRFGPDGWLYCTHGAPCNVCVPPTQDALELGALLRLKPDGSEVEVFARGVRNTVGFDWHPDTGVLHMTINNRDKIGDDTPDDTLVAAPRANLFFGFPWCHPQGTGDPYLRDMGPGLAQGVPDPDFNSDQGALNCSDANAWVRPVQALGPHTAPLGVTFYQYNAQLPANFPPAFNRTAFVALHGSWNRQKMIGSVVMAVKTDSEGHVTSYEPFLSGFLQNRNTTNQTRWGRPVDVAQLPDGSLLVTDGWYNTTYRVTYTQPDNDQGGGAAALAASTGMYLVCLVAAVVVAQLAHLT